MVNFCNHNPPPLGSFKIRNHCLCVQCFNLITANNTIQEKDISYRESRRYTYNFVEKGNFVLGIK